MTILLSSKDNHPPSPYTVDWQNPAPVPVSRPRSRLGSGSFNGAAPWRFAAATDGPGPDPDLGPDPETGAGFCQSAVYGDGELFSLVILDGFREFY